MPLLLIIAFVGVPLLEIWLILQVGAVLGGWTTFGLLVADSLVGAWLLKVQGRRAFADFRQALRDGRWPGDEVAQGALVLVGGTLLLAPGFVTDVVGFLLLLPPTRRVVAAGLGSRIGRAMPWGPLTDARGPGRKHSRRKGPRRQGPRRAGDSTGLGIEVVEVRREQPPPLDGAALGEEPPGDDRAGGPSGGRP